MSNSTSLSDQPDLDAAFERSNRSEWEALATRSLRDGRTLPDLATVTLDGLRIEALHDSYGADKAPPPPLPRKALSHVDNVVRIVMGDTAALATELREALSGGADRLELVGTPSDERLQTILDQSHLQGVGLAFRIDSGDTGDGLDERVRARIESRGSHARPSKLALLRDPIGDAVAGTLAASDMEAAIQAAAQASLAPGNGLLADASAHHNAGASAVDELVASVMLWKSHVEALMAAGLDASAAATRVDVNLAIDANLPESVAKLRALRSLLVDTGSALGLDDTQVPSIITAETSGRFLSRLDPWNNHLRNVLAASAAIISGASRVTVLPHDRLDGATPTARRVARNTAVILLRESHLADANDAAAGSYAIESLTAAMVTKATEQLAQWGSSASWRAALVDGTWAGRLAATQAQRETRLGRGDTVMVGVTKYQATDDGARSAAAASAAAAAATSGASGASGASGDEPATAASRDPGQATSPPLLPVVRDAEPFELALHDADNTNQGEGA